MTRNELLALAIAGVILPQGGDEEDRGMATSIAMKIVRALPEEDLRWILLKAINRAIGEGMNKGILYN